MLLNSIDSFDLIEKYWIKLLKVSDQGGPIQTPRAEIKWADKDDLSPFVIKNYETKTSKGDHFFRSS